MAPNLVLDGCDLNDGDVDGLGDPDNAPDYLSRQGGGLVLCAVSEGAVEGGNKEESDVHFPQ